MKITNLFTFATALLLMACNKPAQPVIPQESNFKGTVTVIYQDAPFDNENIEVNFKPSADGKTGSLTIYQIKFVPQMPVTYRPERQHCRKGNQLLPPFRIRSHLLQGEVGVGTRFINLFKNYRGPFPASQINS